MINIKPFNQKKIFGLDFYFLELAKMYGNGKYPNKLLLTGLKGIGKSTLAYHFINYILSLEETEKYDLKNFEINSQSNTFKTILNKSNPNLINIDVSSDKKFIDIGQIRDLILTLSKSSLNNKPRFVLIDNIEFLNVSSINALLKILEEPNKNINFILINNNKKILPTLLSRCINYKISLTNIECLNISNKILDDQLEKFINVDLINYYSTPGNIYNLVKFAYDNNYDLSQFSLGSFLKLIIDENFYKKDPFIRYIVFDLIEFYLSKLNSSISKKFDKKYSYFIKRISDTRNFNLDEETLFSEIKEKVLNA